LGRTLGLRGAQALPSPLVAPPLGWLVFFRSPWVSRSRALEEHQEEVELI